MNALQVKNKADQKRVLVIDDDEDEQLLLTEAFKAAQPSCAVTCLSNGKSGLCYLQQLADDELPSLIVLDYHLPGCNGDDVLRCLQTTQRLNAIPVIIYSTIANQLGSLTGVKAFVEKGKTWRETQENVRIFLFYGAEGAALAEPLPVL